MTYAKAKVTKLRVASGKEIDRIAFADIPGGKNADGITFDAQGRMYVTAGDLFRISADGKQVDKLGTAYGANADFGMGPLACTDLYTAGNGKGIARTKIDAPGRSVPWHRLVYKETVPPPAPPPPVPAKLAQQAQLELITSETTEALDLVAVPGEPVGRLFIVEKQGPIRILRGKTFAPKPFLDLTGKVSLWTKPNGEQGLLGLAFHPKYRKNGRFFINYTDPKGDIRVVEYQVDKKDPDLADPTPVREILVVDQPYNNHNGGDLEFGPDGKLYVVLGDGGSGGDPLGSGQNPDTVLAKMLRIDVDASTIKPQVVGQGLRNPWRYTFDRKTGDLYIGDVGQNVFEMVHFVPRAKLAGPHNFGWNILEAKHCYKADDCERKGLREAVVEYPHTDGCSIAGGYVYRGKALPALHGVYFYSDYCTALLRSFRMKNGKVGRCLGLESGAGSRIAAGEDLGLRRGPGRRALRHHPRGADLQAGPTLSQGPRASAHVVAGVAAGMLLQVVLVVVLGGGDGAGIGHFGDDGALPLAGLRHPGLHLFGDLALLRARSRRSRSGTASRRRCPGG